MNQKRCLYHGWRHAVPSESSNNVLEFLSEQVFRHLFRAVARIPISQPDGIVHPGPLSPICVSVTDVPRSKPDYELRKLQRRKQLHLESRLNRITTRFSVAAQA